MMSYQKERDEFIALAAAEGLPLDTTRALLRYSQTLHRLAEAQCNGDWPADNGDRKVEYCGGGEKAGCGSMWAPSTLKGKGKLCPDCRTTALVHAILPAGFGAIFAGDPRGCVFKLTVPSGRTNDGGREGICVPVRAR
jgi:hypothetical protein